MYAIVDVAGQQFKVSKEQKIFVHRLDVEEGAEVEFDKVLLIDNDDKVEVGEPVIKGALIKGKILEHLKGDTVKVFKKKRRKGYKVLKGHREYLSHVLIEEIIEKGATKSVAKKETAKVTQTQKATPKAVSAKKTVAKSSEAKAETATTRTVKSTPATKKPAAEKAKPKTEIKTSTKKATTTKSGSKVIKAAKKMQTGTTAKKKITKKTTSSKKTKE